MHIINKLTVYLVIGGQLPLFHQDILVLLGIHMTHSNFGQQILMGYFCFGCIVH